MLDQIKDFVKTHSVAIIIAIIAISAVIVIIMFRNRDQIVTVPQTTNVHDAALSQYDSMQGVQTLNTVYNAANQQAVPEMQEFQQQQPDQEQMQYMQEINTNNQQYPDQQYPDSVQM